MSSFHRADWLALASPIVTVAVVVGGYYVAYWQERGKARAAAENVDKLTRAVEDIKTENAVLLEELRSRNQMRMAAIDKRLKAHQEAFKLWRALFRHAHSEEIATIVKECEAWWEDNCLYLDKSAREAFADAYWAAGLHKSLLDSPVRNDAAISEITRNWAMIERAGDAIVRGAELPGLTNAEREEVREAGERSIG